MDSTSPQKQESRSMSPLKAPRKRKRIVISCTECHRRKQKCDRAAPCSNCVARNKQSLCHYENESARKQQLLEESNHRNAEGGSYSVIKPGESESAAQVSAFGYSKTNGNNNTTLGIFRKIENYGSDPSAVPAHFASHSMDNGGLREKYKNMIRQLPSKQYIEKLLATYFREVNYQYYPLDEGIFRDHLKDWHNLSFSTLNKGPLELPIDLQFFPALLFQTLALALQFQPPDYDPCLDSLKYAAAMSFDDLAQDYSESGCQILCLLGKRNNTLITVQAGFLRTAYLKNCGLVPESWHYLSQTIRDAQEIGLHKDMPSYRARTQPGSPEDVLENLWVDQLRRRMWLILSLWDIHMALALGRPTTIDSRDGKPAFPIDSPVPKNRREVAPSPRTDSDPPTPLTVLLWNAEIAAPLWDIFNLEREDPNQNNIAKVEQMHVLINQINLHCPPFFRAKNPDTTFDSHPDCYWLPVARPLFENGAAFTIMLLHRPYIFTNPSSRTAALKAGLDILRAQRIYFGLLQEKHYKMFSIVLNTFDAIVLVAAIYILHPCENVDDLDTALQHFEWAMERFQTISGRNSMAASGLGVLKAIHVRLQKALSGAKCPPRPLAQPQQQQSNTPTSNLSPPVLTPDSSSSTNNSNQNTQLPTPAHTHPSISTASTTSSTNTNQSITNNGNNNYTLPTISNITEASSQPSNNTGWESFTNVQMPIPGNNIFDFSGIAPLHPMHDLLYNDLGTVDGGAGGGGLDLGNGMDQSWEGTGVENGGGGGANGGQWQFEGDFGNDSFWGFMNNYNP